MSFKPWTSIELNYDSLQSLLNSGDFELIAQAEKDLGFSSGRLEDGEHKAALWLLVTRSYFAHGGNREMLAADWEQKLGPYSFACYVKAMLALGDAARARGRGSADTVTSWALEVHYEDLEKADEFLDRCPSKIKKTLPWHVAKLSVAYQLPRFNERREAQLRAAIAAWPDAIQTYLPAVGMDQPFSIDYGQVERVARLAVAASQESMRSAMYGRLYERVFSGSNHHSIADSSVNWSDLKVAFQDVEDTGNFPFYVPGGFAQLACAMEDRTEARRQLEIAEGIMRDRYGTYRRQKNDPCVSYAFGSSESG